MTTAITADRPVAELALNVAGAAQTFQRLGLDFCCGGRRSLAAACEAQGLDLNQVLAALAEAQAAPENALPDGEWRTAPLAALTTHIVTRHHQYVRGETPRINTWLDKVVAAHGARHPEVSAIRGHFQALSAELAAHMAKEELILFPAIAQLPEGGPAARGICGHGLGAPIRQMMLEHDDAGRELDAMRAASGNYAPPQDACTTFRVLYTALAAFEADLHQHVHLENNILFPRTLEAEEQSHA